MNNSDQLFTADLHCDTIHRILQGADFSRRNEIGHLDLPRLIEGGIDLQVFACFTESFIEAKDRVPLVHRMLDGLHRTVEAHGEKVALARTSSEAARNRAAGKISAVFSIENGLVLNDNLDTLRQFYERGVRSLTLTHNVSSAWCISSADEHPAFDGLTAFGREVVRMMDELGMIVDLSHAAPSAVAAVLEIATRPVIASHSCVRALCDHHRNLTDEQIRGIAATGGMVGINFLCDFLSPACRDASAAYINAHYDLGRRYWLLFTAECGAEEYAARRAELQPFLAGWEQVVRATGVDVGVVADHIDYIVRLVGPDHVGLGSDFDGITFAPAGLEDCAKMPRLADELRGRGYCQEDLAKIMGGNFLRVFREVCG